MDAIVQNRVFTQPLAAGNSARNISELCKSLICRHSLKNAGEVVLAVFFIGECDFDSMGVDLSGRNFAKTIAKDSGPALMGENVLASTCKSGKFPL
jgi:hypothetical protein